MTDDFFSNVPAASAPEKDDPHDDFAHAISARFGSADLRTARLLPDDHPHAAPHHPQPARQRQPPPPPRPPSPSSFSSVPPPALQPYLADTRTLVLDIRPHAAHAAARVNHALSLSVPTTLLKRPLFSLARLSQMLPSPSARARFADWASASRILVYDSDSTLSPDNSIIAGLLRKFRAEGFTGELGWVRGGFQAVWKEAHALTTTEPLTPEEDDPDASSSFGTLRTTHLPKAAFSLSSTTTAPPLQLGAIPGPNPVPNTPAPSASRAANPFFDTIRQNVELSHGITERIPLRLPRRVRRRIHDLPFQWLQDIARRSALRPSPASRHPGFDSFESGSESSDDPYTSDPDENDPDVEEGTEALAMQFYRIELAEQRRLRSIMDHHTRESEVSLFTTSTRPRRVLDRDGGRMCVPTGAKTVPGTPHPAAFPFSITAAVEKGTKNRYTHIWPFEHARVRLHDGRHQGSYPCRRDKSKALERGRSTKERSGGKGKEREEQGQERDSQRRSRSSPAFGESQDPRDPEMVGASLRHSFYFDSRSSISGTSVEFKSGQAHSGTSVPQVKIEYDTTEQDFRMSGPPTPATALPFPTPPFYTPMEMPASTPMRLRPPQLLSHPSGITASSGERLRGMQTALPASGLPFLAPLPSFPLRLPDRMGGLLPSIGEQIQTSESLSPSATTLGVFTNNTDIIGKVVEGNPQREPSPADDYVNASYVQPLGTHKRYIATQGPLPSTYVDFWTLVWEQNVHVIVMLTREVENAMVKCGSYWTDTEYGPLRLELVFTSPPMSPSANPSSVDVSMQGFFAIREPQGKNSGACRDQPALITRTFTLSHTSYPGVPPRRITHLQYLEWSDMNVPDDPRGVLDLVKRVEQAVAESTPGPSPNGTWSPGSGCGSLSGGQSPDIGPNSKGYDSSLLSPISAGAMPRGKGKRGSEWRHPELDAKSGVATFALGRAAPVLLHCSAGVGRTGGFIAVDAILDGIRTELQKNREEQRLREASGLRAVMTGEDTVAVNGVEASGELNVGRTEMGANSMKSSGEKSFSDDRERMDIDEPTTKRQKTKNSPHMLNTVPIIVSAGDSKGRRCHNHGKDASGQKQCSSPESLVVHVPCAGTDDAPEGSSITRIDLDDTKGAGWPSTSTREWVEQISDQAHAHAEEGDLPPLPLHPPPSRERSPGDTSNSSGQSALNSVDDSMNGSESASARGSGNESRVEQKSDTGSASGSGIGSGSGHPPPSSASKPGSASLSTVGSGTGSGSGFGSSLLRARLWESSVTSVSAESLSSFSLGHESKLNGLHHRASVIRASSNFDMEIDCPPRPVSVPLQSTRSSTVVLRHAVRPPHHEPIPGSSLVACLSSPILPPGTTEKGISFFGGDATEGPASRPSSDPGSDGQTSPAQGGEGVPTEGSGKRSRTVSEESGGPAFATKSRSNLRLDTELSCLKIPETLHSSDSSKNPPLPPRDKEKATLLIPSVLDNSASQQFSNGSGPLDASEHGQRAVDYPVIDYKLPRELHSDLSPTPISSLSEPICTIIQDMREQRMSLCQSLRQYVFVHAAIIEGALRIADEERELWGYGATSEDTSSTEGEAGASVRKCGRRSGRDEAKAWFGGISKTEVEFERGIIPHRTHLLHTMTQPLNHRSSERAAGGNQASFAPTSSSGVSSPSKGKRAPSPTELLREDKTGALSLNKRPSILRQRTSYDGEQFSFESNRSSPVTGENGGQETQPWVRVGLDPH